MRSILEDDPSAFSIPAIQASEETLKHAFAFVLNAARRSLSATYYPIGTLVRLLIKDKSQRIKPLLLFSQKNDGDGDDDHHLPYLPQFRQVIQKLQILLLRFLNRGFLQVRFQLLRFALLLAR